MDPFSNVCISWMNLFVGQLNLRRFSSPCQWRISFTWWWIVAVLRQSEPAACHCQLFLSFFLKSTSGLVKPGSEAQFYSSLLISWLVCLLTDWTHIIQIISSKLQELETRSRLRAEPSQWFKSWVWQKLSSHLTKEIYRLCFCPRSQGKDRPHLDR